MGLALTTHGHVTPPATETCEQHVTAPSRRNARVLYHHSIADTMGPRATRSLLLRPLPTRRRAVEAPCQGLWQRTSTGHPQNPVPCCCCCKGADATLALVPTSADEQTTNTDHSCKLDYCAYACMHSTCLGRRRSRPWLDPARRPHLVALLRSLQRGPAHGATAAKNVMCGNEAYASIGGSLCGQSCRSHRK